jgi:hypothetical protein
MNAYTRELLERESILLQSRQDTRMDEPVTSPRPFLAAESVAPECHAEVSRSVAVRTVKDNLWQLLQTPVPDLLFGRPTRRLCA